MARSEARLPGTDLQEGATMRQHRKAKAIAMAQDSRFQFIINAAGVLTVLLLGAMVEVAALQHFDPSFQLDAAQLQASHPAMQHIKSR
jgi:hypothetical protein